MFIQEWQHWEANLESEMFIFKVLATYHLSQNLGEDIWKGEFYHRNPLIMPAYK